MINIRKGVFETNSSSTHSICITDLDDEVYVPNSISINLEEYEFGWEYERWYASDEKLAYLVLGIINISYNQGFQKGASLLEKLLDDLNNMGVKDVTIDGITVKAYDGEYYFESEGYVDHADQLGELIEAVMNDREMLKRFLFSKKSIIFGGNDNNDEEFSEVDVQYPHRKFFKGN